MATCIQCTSVKIIGKGDFCSSNCESLYWDFETSRPAVNHNEQTKRVREKIMATKVETLVTHVDDLTNEEFEEGKGETVEYAFDGVKYEIDLTTKNATAFRKAFEKYVKVSRERKGTRKSGEPSEATVIREWARANGHNVNDRGRIPEDVVNAYQAAHK